MEPITFATVLLVASVLCQAVTVAVCKQRFAGSERYDTLCAVESSMTA